MLECIYPCRISDYINSIFKTQLDMEEEKISVIIPIYNVENYLRKCLDSVVNQTYKNLEILLVDDESSDSSGLIADEYAQKDSRIRVFHNKNMGVSGARNYGLDHMKGDYVAFIDSDDYVDLTYFEKLYKALKDTASDMSVCGFDYIFENRDNKFKIKHLFPNRTRVLGKEQALKNIFSYSRRTVSFTTAWANLAKKELYQGVRYPLRKIVEDMYTTYKLYLNADKIAYYNESLYFYVQRTGSIVNSPFTLEKTSMIDLYDEKLRLLKENNQFEAYNLTLYRYYLMLNFVKIQVERNNLDFDTRLIDDKLKSLNDKELSYRFNPKLDLNKLLEKDLSKYILKIFYKFR